MAFHYLYLWVATHLDDIALICAMASLVLAILAVIGMHQHENDGDG